MEKYVKEDLEKLIFDENLPYDKIGELYQVTGAAIRKNARKLGIELPQRRKINPSETFNKGKKDQSKIKYCLNCSNELKSTSLKYCCIDCQNEYAYNNYIDQWKQGLESGVRGKVDISNHIRKYLFDKYNHQCQKCG
jgi:hypothetical protein